MLVGTIIEEIWKPIFLKKIHCSRQKLFFCLVKNNIVHLSDISGCEKRFSSFQLVEKDFLFSGNRILSFRVLLKFLKFKGSNFFEEKPYFCSWKLIFWLIFFFFSFFFHLSDTAPNEGYFLPSGNGFLNEFFIPYGGDEFSVLWKSFSVI